MRLFDWVTKRCWQKKSKTLTSEIKSSQPLRQSQGHQCVFRSCCFFLCNSYFTVYTETCQHICWLKKTRRCIIRAASPLPSLPLSRATPKSYIYEVTLKWQVRTPRPFRCACLSPGVGPASSLGPHVTGPLAGWHRAFQLKLSGATEAAWGHPDYVLSAHSLTPKTCLHY